MNIAIRFLLPVLTFSLLGVLTAAAVVWPVPTPAFAMTDSASATSVVGTAGLEARSTVQRPLRRTRWLSDVQVTEYFPVPEAWFVGRRVKAPGLARRHRVDWLYSARGMSMEGDGIGLDGQRYHISGLGEGGWVSANGRRTKPTRRGWRPAPPAWRSSGFWRNRGGEVTFPLEAGGWQHGVGRRYVSPNGITFSPGPSRPLSFYRSAAVDPRLIPLRSLLYVSAYRTQRGGWMRAADVGGAIIGRHIDVYRPPPPVPSGGEHLPSERILVVPPSAQRRGLPRRLPRDVPAPPSGI